MKRCSGPCGREIKRGDTYYQAITAWVANEKRDSVTLRKNVDPPRFACRSCIKNWQLGISQGQEALFQRVVGAGRRQGWG